MDSKTFVKQWDAERAEHAAKPWYIRKPIDIKDYLWYRVIRRIPDIPREIKWKWQTLTKGYCDCDLWGLDHFIVDKVRAPLKEFIRYQEEKGHSLPNEFGNDPAGWLVVLKKIEFSFDYMWKDDHDMDSWSKEGKTHEEVMAESKKVQEGFELFGRYFVDLWD